jgi:hypothetical protein
MDRAGATQRHAAAELGAGHAEHVAKHPERRRVVVDVDALVCSVDFDIDGHRCLERSDEFPMIEIVHNLNMSSVRQNVTIVMGLPCLVQAMSTSEIRMMRCRCDDCHRSLLAAAVSAAIIAGCLAHFLRSRRFASSKRLPDT